MSIADSIEKMVRHVLDKLENLRVDTIRPNSSNRLTIHHPNGSSILFDNDGNVYIDGKKVYINGELGGGGGVDVEDSGGSPVNTENINFGDGLDVSLDGDGTITVDGSTGYVTNPLSEDLDTEDKTIYRSNGTLTFESSDGTFKFQKRS